MSLSSIVRAAVLLSLFLPSLAHADFILEVRELNSVSPPFSRYVYGCNTCTLAEFDAVVAPAGFEKAGSKLLMPSSVTTNLPTPPAGVAPSLDLVPTIPGDDFTYIAEVLSGAIVGIDPTFGFLAVAQVLRDTEFTYDAGEVIHEVVDPSGKRYVLFGYDVGLASLVDPGTIGALSGFPVPAGWSTASRQLTAPLVVSSGGQAEVFSQGTFASYQFYAVPEPGTAALVGIGLLLAARRPARRRAGSNETQPL